MKSSKPKTIHLKPWDHIRMSLSMSAKVLLVLLTVLVHHHPTEATSFCFCSNYFRFDELCPDPRFGSRDSSSVPNHQPIIHLRHRRVNGEGGSATHVVNNVGSTSSKDSSTPRCDFYPNRIENVALTAVHITENPWDFRHANACTNIVKFDYDVYEGDGSQLQMGRNGRTSGSTRTNNKRDPICSNKIGLRRYASNEGNVRADEQLDGKSEVYFWHNFTLYSHSAQFVDSISNYHLSKEEVSCVPSRAAQYVQIAVDVSISGRCEIVLQQYKIDQGRSPHGCNGVGYPNPIPRQIQFCGSYDCSQSNYILTRLKLLRRREDLGVGGSSNWSRNEEESSKTSRRGNVEGQSFSPSQEKAGGESGGATEGSSNYDYKHYKHNSSEEKMSSGHSATEATHHPTTTNDDEEEEPEPIDWREVAFISVFPACGVLFILLVLNILHSRSAREICGGYPYPRPTTGSFYQSSTNSIDKSSRPM